MINELWEFLEGINHKKEKVWKQLYADYYSPLCCYALKILKNRDQATDVVQGVIVKLWETEVYFEDMPSFHGYLYRSVYHNCLKILRDKNVEQAFLNKQEEEGNFDCPESFYAVLEEETVRKLRDIIDRMPVKRREVMLLCLEEKSVEEISIQLGISVNTVKKHKKEAYHYIRKVLNVMVLSFIFG